jgi:Cu+-exporting ATPase
MKKTVRIEGMMCNHCKMHVEEALSNVKGIKNVKVDLKKGLAIVDSNSVIDETLIRQAVLDAGYSVTVIED